MDFFKKSQLVKDEILADQSLIARIQEHMGTKFDRLTMAFGNPADLSPLSLIGAGTTNRVYHLGKTRSGLWVSLRENSVYGRNPEEVAAAAKIYNSYCQEAEMISDAPSFGIGGITNGLPFLLLEDVSEAGKYHVTDSASGEKRLMFSDGTRMFQRSVDLGIDDPYRNVVDRETEMAMICGTFDITEFKYFQESVRINL